MIIPAICKAEEIREAFNRMRYSDAAMYFNGCLDEGEMIIPKEPSNGRIQYAIVDSSDNLIGYIGYFMDYYSESIYGFGLINFTGKPNALIMNAIQLVIKQILKLNPHRVEFRAVGGNPANKGYKKICDNMAKYDYKTTIHTLTDYIKDKYGNFRDSYIYELIKEVK